MIVAVQEVEKALTVDHNLWCDSLESDASAAAVCGLRSASAGSEDVMGEHNKEEEGLGIGNPG